jgi:hypothetical protein
VITIAFILMFTVVVVPLFYLDRAHKRIEKLNSQISSDYIRENGIFRHPSPPDPPKGQVPIYSFEVWP